MDVFVKKDVCLAYQHSITFAISTNLAIIVLHIQFRMLGRNKGCSQYQRNFG